MITLLGALTEAWEEVKINRARVILSLIGVGAAVWAMSTVIALGEIASASAIHQTAQWAGARGTIIIHTQGEDSGSYNDFGIPVDASGNTITPDASHYRKAALATVEQLGAPYWTTYHSFNVPHLDAPGWDPCPDGDCATEEQPSLTAVDPQYFNIYSRMLITGRTLTNADAQRQMNPVVINESAWRAMGKPPVESHPRLWISQDHKTAVTVVGVINNISTWESTEIFTPAESISYLIDQLDESSYPELRIVAPAGEEKQASQVATSVLQAHLGAGFTASSSYEGSSDDSGYFSRVITLVVAVIGAIVILLGALGLLTVSIITVKGRVREIGIRRAVGASARRIFFSVFLESVVATTAAGFIGVIASVITTRLAPLESIFGTDFGGLSWAYPMRAALLGVLISASIGALCGIIPATIAVKMRPIDAIRF